MSRCINLLCTAFNLNVSKINSYYNDVQFVKPPFKSTELNKPIKKQELMLLINIAIDLLKDYHGDTIVTYPKSIISNDEKKTKIRNYNENKYNKWKTLLEEAHVYILLLIREDYFHYQEVLKMLVNIY